MLAQYLNLSDSPDNYDVNFPEHLSRSGLRGPSINQDRARLGRVLFYDKHLSKDEKISCASCHKQELGFSDNQRISPGVYGRTGTRNAIALASVANFASYYGTDLNGAGAIPFFWDNRASTASIQNKGSLTNPAEMDMHMDEVVDAVRTQPYYAPLFLKAYGTNEITSERVSDAIAQFVNAMGSYRSKFDEEASKALNNSSSFAGFTNSENRGKTIYMSKCSNCHSSSFGRPVMYFANNGLDGTLATDLGVGGKTGVGNEIGCFKVPTLRNIALTAPYMHDGRFQTLEEVLEHYSTGIKAHPNLHYFLKVGGTPNGAPLQMNLTDTDKQDLINFLHTLTDNKFITDPRFSNPFK